MGGAERALWQTLLQRYHYLSFTTRVGKSLNYLAFDRQARPVAVLLFGAAAWKVAGRDQFIGWTVEQRRRNLHRIANNMRYREPVDWSGDYRVFSRSPWTADLPASICSPSCAKKRATAPIATPRWGLRPISIASFSAPPEIARWHVGAAANAQRQMAKPQSEGGASPLRRVASAGTTLPRRAPNRRSAPSKNRRAKSGSDTPAALWQSYSMMNTPRVDVYYARVCGLCTNALEFFRSRGVTFTAYAVEWDEKKQAFADSENTRAMYRRCGKTVDFVPQMFIGDTHVAGWRKLEPMIASGEIDSLIPRPG